MKILLLRVKGDLACRNQHPRNVRPPYLLKYLQALLLQAGFECKIHDLYLPYPEKLPEDWVPDVLGLSILTSDSEASIEKINLYREKNPGLKVIVCGQDVSGRPEYYFRNEIDFLAAGEAEMAVFTLIRSGFSEIPPGVSSAQSRVIPETVTVINLDQLPFPEYTSNELDGYFFYYPVKVDFSVRYGHILASRGCPCQCPFCSPVFRESYGNSLRLRNVESVAAEIQKLKNAGVNFILFDDDNFGADRSWTGKLLKKMMDDGINLPWQCHLRPENIDEKTASLFHRSGCRLLRIGGESGSEKVLENSGKTDNPADFLKKVKKVFRICRKNDIQTLFLGLLGSPGERFSDVLKTLFLIQKLRPDLLQLSFLTLYPCSLFFSRYSDKKNSSIYHYELPDKILCSMSRTVLWFSQFLLYAVFYLNPVYIYRHLRCYYVFYLHNRRVFFRLIRSVVYLMK